MSEKFDVTKHVLVPEHIKLSADEKKKLLEDYGITIKHLPRISSKDPAILHLGVKAEDVVKIIRKSPTSGQAIFYRGVVDE